MEPETSDQSLDYGTESPKNKEIDMNFSDEDDLEESGNSSNVRRRSRRTTTKLSAHLKGLMGEANLRYARGDIDVAKRMCFEVIRQAPDAYEPFITLSQMYENTNVKKYMGYLMLAAHLSPQNSSIWCRLAEVNLQENNITEAISCYSRAIRAEPRNIDLHMKRIELLTKKGDAKAVLNCKMRMVNAMSNKQCDTIFNICKDVVKQYYEQKNYTKAIEALEVLFKRFSDNVTQDILNIMLELLLSSQKYTVCLEYFTQFCGCTFDIFVKEDNTIVVNSFEKPTNLQVDLKMKFIICLIRLKSEHLISDLINSILLEDDVEQVGDLYLDVVEALMNTNYHAEALKLLIPLVKSKTYSLAAVWLKYAECLNCCEMFDQSIDAYFTVMGLAPQHVEVLYPLAMLLLKQNRKKEALEVLAQDLSGNKVDVLVLIEQMKLLKQINDLESYWKCAELLLSRHSIILKYPDELKIVITKESYKEKVAKLRKIRTFRNDFAEIETNLISIREPTAEDEYNTYREILQFAKDQKEFNKLQKFAFMGLSSKRFQKHFDEIYMLTYLSCIHNSDYFHGYSIIRDMLVHHLDNNLAWNWFTLIMQTPDDVRHSRFLDRYMDIDWAKIIEANYCVTAGNYMPALAYFMKQYKQNQNCYAAFMIGIVMLQLYNQRTLDKKIKKTIAETVSYLFLNYAKKRTPNAKHEIYYNLGRMYQQLGVIYLAVHYYKLVLNYSNDLIDNYPDILCLKKEAAFNLHVIYRNSGNFIAARNVIMKYIEI